jgi:polysaccharide export outer membrane protein
MLGAEDGNWKSQTPSTNAMKLASIICCGVLIGLVGCAGLPSGGPTSSDIRAEAGTSGAGRFNIVEVDGRVIEVLQARPIEDLSTTFSGYSKPPSPTINVGDSISVSIFQSGGLGTGLLSGTMGSAGTAPQTVLVPEQVVAADGAISVPYAGRPRAAGRTPLQVQQEIEQRLAESAQKPQVIVTVTKSVSDKVTVGGDIVNGSRIPLSIRGERILDVIASAGGVKTPLYETFVRLSRGGRTVTVSMERLVADPKENIYVWPDDVITLVRTPQTFTVFGATTTNAQISFNASEVTLAQAIAKAGGLQDIRADPSGVFLFRFEPKATAQALRFPPVVTQDGRSPVLYHVNLQDAQGYFLAGRFLVQNDDIIYVANAASNQFQKFLTLLGTLTQPVFSGFVVVQGVR